MAILRVIESGDPWVLHASKADSKSFTGKGVVGRFEPGAQITVYRGVPDAVVRAYLNESDPDARKAILGSRESTTANSAVSVDAADFAGWMRLCGTRSAAGRAVATGILAIPESVNADAAIDAMLALAGLDPAEFADPAPEQKTESPFVGDDPAAVEALIEAAGESNLDPVKVEAARRAVKA